MNNVFGNKKVIQQKIHNDVCAAEENLEEEL